MIRALQRLHSEFRLLGWQAARQRAVFELSRRLGVTALRNRAVRFSLERYLDDRRLPRDPDEYLLRWRQQRRPLGLGEPSAVEELLRQVLDEDQLSVLKARARDRSADRFCLFHHTTLDYPGESRWHHDPESGEDWPTLHASRLLLQLAKRGDIKVVWEIGRFAWVFDLVRAWLMDRDERHIDLLFDLIAHFAEKNPLHIGPHWASEQEVAIRALMLVFVQEILAHGRLLTGRRLQLLHALMDLHGRYLYDELDYARIAIRNNHLIFGATGLYAMATCLPGHAASDRWSTAARDILLEAVDEQWYEDGGYVQPSNNYHRAAWHGMLWAHRIAVCRGDAQLANALRARAPMSLDLFLAQIDASSGRLPNWGANDGALVGAWTSCDYADFRPLVQALAFLCDRELPFGRGAWDEEGLWFFGEAFLRADREPCTQPAEAQFPRQGIHVMRPSRETFAFMRCGSVISRYGQQADQLHVDLWRGGENIAVDAGSYNYSKSGSVHNWFRGTSGHNTIVLDEQDQMIPHRKFKYLNWSKAVAESCEVPGADRAFVGVHDGYTRLDAAFVHARLLMFVGGTWVVVDRVWPEGQVERAIRIRLHWQVAAGEMQQRGNAVSVRRKAGTSTFAFFSDRAEFELTTCSGMASADEFDGWVSRYYNYKEPVNALNFSGETRDQILLVTTEAPSAPRVDVLAADRELAFDGRRVSIAPLFGRAQALLQGLRR